jgi:hypothetical protein
VALTTAITWTPVTDTLPAAGAIVLVARGPLPHPWKTDVARLYNDNWWSWLHGDMKLIDDVSAWAPLPVVGEEGI